MIGLKLLSGTVSAFLILASVSRGGLQPAQLECEYQQNPIGIDASKPRLSWLLQSDGKSHRGQEQTAYHILAASSEALLKPGEADLWDSSKVSSAQSVLVEYAGQPLASRQRCYWKVKVWDEHGMESGWSKPATWTMGLLQVQDWQPARWIGAGRANTSSPPVFRHEFDISKPIRRATVFVCGLGHYELWLNGRRVGDQVIDPGWTDYRDTCLYSSFDVTKQLARGRNAVGVMVGNGMYNVVGGRYVKFKGSFGPPKLILQLAIEYTDGSFSILGTDEQWRTAAGPITFSCTYGGEDYDARLEMPGWDCPRFDDRAWHRAQLCEGPGGTLRSQSAPPIKIAQEFKTVKITEPKPGVFV